MKQVGLEDRAHHTSAELSGGQQQRVAIARALVTAPSVMFADEPTGNLDSKRSHEIMDLLASLNETRGLTIVLVTHEEDIADYAHRQIRFLDGRIASDTVREEGARMIANAFLLALREIRNNLMRAGLTTLGIVIGVAAVIGMVTLGSGATKRVTADIASMGRNLLIVIPGQRKPGHLRQRRRRSTSPTPRPSRAKCRG